MIAPCLLHCKHRIPLQNVLLQAIVMLTAALEAAAAQHGSCHTTHIERVLLHSKARQVELPAQPVGDSAVEPEEGKAVSMSGTLRTRSC